MRKIAVVGAGLGGLILANGLLEKGYRITLLSERSDEEIRRGSILSSQSLWWPAIEVEKKFGLNNWDKTYRGIGGFHVRFGDTRSRRYREFASALTRPGQSVDYRLKLPLWMKLFQRRGGTLCLKNADTRCLEELAATHDLVIVCTGRAKGDMVDLFPVDRERTSFSRPQRVGAVVYVKNRAPGSCAQQVSAPFEEWTLIPDVGEFFVIPALSLTGDCHIICLEGYLGGPFDCWRDIKLPDECLAGVKRLLKEWLPWEWERCRDIALIDDHAAISGGFTPTIRHPIGRLPSGKCVLAFGDLFVLNDPLVAQGGNTAIKLAALLIDEIIGRDTGSFDEGWLQSYCNKAWDDVRWAIAISTMFLAPDKNLWTWFDRACTDNETASKIVRGYEDPKSWVSFLGAPAPDLRDVALGDNR